MERDAEFTSVWDGGVEVTSPCKVNMDTGEVFNFGIVDVSGLQVLEGEYVTIDGERHAVSQDGPGDSGFWYE